MRKSPIASKSNMPNLSVPGLERSHRNRICPVDATEAGRVDESKVTQSRNSCDRFPPPNGLRKCRPHVTPTSLTASDVTTSDVTPPVPPGGFPRTSATQSRSPAEMQRRLCVSVTPRTLYGGEISSDVRGRCLLRLSGL